MIYDKRLNTQESKIKRGVSLVDTDTNQQEIKLHGTFDLPLEFYDCNNRVYKDLYIHWHKQMEIIYVITGKMILRLNNNLVEASSGDFIFIAPETVHYIKSGEELLEFKSLVFDLRILNGSSDDFCQNKVAQPLISHQMKISNKIVCNDKNYEEIKKCFFALDECRKNKKNYYQLEAKYLIFRFFHQILTGGHYSQISLESNKLTASVKSAITYIQSNFTSELTTGSISKYVHYNEYYFMRIFKKYTGRTIVEYITEYRLEKAKELLQKDELSIEEIANQVGFSTTSYFSSKFREMFHVTPSEFRKEMQGDTKK